MRNLSLRAFEIVLFLFSISVILTMYSMTSEDDEGTLLGFNYGYYLLPLFVINLFVCFVYLKSISFQGFRRWILAWLIIASFNVLLLMSSNKIVNMIRVNMWTTSFFSAYLLAKTTPKTTDSIIKLFIVVYIISFIFFWMGKIYQQDNVKRGVETSTNAVYCLVTLVPILMLSKNNKLKLLLLFATLTCAVFSNKRGATLIMALILIPTLNDTFSDMKSKIWRISSIVVIGIFVIIGFIYIGNEYVGGRLVERFSATSETGGAGRLFIWEYVINQYISSSLFEQLFGHGHRGVALLGIQTAAHNDFLEVLFDYGVVGLFFYLGIHLFLIKKTRWLRKTKNMLYLPYLTMYLIFFIMSMVSILIVQQRYLIYMAVFWGMLEGDNYTYTYKIHIKTR